MKKILVLVLMTFMSFSILSAEENISNTMTDSTPLPGMRGKPINLPDVSALGNIVGYTSDNKKDKDRNNLLLEETEMAFQGYIYPDLRADLIIAINSDGKTEVCEGKASFQNLGYGFSGEVGKIHIDFGKVNKLHTHHLPFTDRPLVLNKFLGEDELAGQGATLKYLIPILPFYSQIQAGFWKIEKPEEGQFFPTDKSYSARWNSSFDLGNKKELEVGFSGLTGRGPGYVSDQKSKDNVDLVGVDITFKWFPSSYEKWTFQNEWIHLRREIPEGKLNRDGFYSFINYRANKYWDYGLRFDYSENSDSAISYERAISAIVTNHLTETTYWRITAKHRNIDGKNITEGWFQLSFGIGPHSHELE
jgi:hypothetical protein